MHACVCACMRACMCACAGCEFRDGLEKVLFGSPHEASILVKEGGFVLLVICFFFVSLVSVLSCILLFRT